MFFFPDQAGRDGAAQVPTYGVLRKSPRKVRGEGSGRSDLDVHGQLEQEPEIPESAGEEPHKVYLRTTDRQRHQVMGKKSTSIFFRDL